MQMFNHIFNVFAVFLTAHLCVKAKQCNPEHLKNSNVFLGWKNDFNFYPWTVYQHLKGTVKFLEIRNQFVKELCKDYLSDAIMEVVFVNINLDFIEPGFFQSDKLEQVYIESNNLKTIHKGVFSGTMIKTLILSDNKIEVIEENAFENMHRLEAIALDYNKIKTFDPNWFNGAKVLYEVSIDHNNITELPEGTSKNMVEYVDKFPSFKVYGSIDFDNNNIEHIHPRAFSNLKNFGVISLSNNKLLLLSPDIFGGLDFLYNLYMNTNNFICFSNKTISSFHGVKRLFLAQNQINDDCKLMVKEYFDNKSDLVLM